MSRRGATYLRIRYLIDKSCAVMLLIMLSPFLLAISVVILFSSGRPVLFLQQRVGEGGRLFRIVKFRTMIEEAESIGGGYMPPEKKLVTPVGRVLRKTSLDELPQLINIVRGEMALIGPRPSLPSQYERYTDFQKRRAEIRPGVTGLAQVVYRNDAPWSKRIELDVQYIDSLGPSMDIKIVAKTISKVLGRSGISMDQTAEDVDDLGTEFEKRSSD